MKNTKNTLLTGALVLGIATTAGAGFALADDTTTDTTRNSFPPGIAMGKGHGMPPHQHDTIAATLLGITQEEFDARVANGETPKDMLDAAGITKEDIHAAKEANMQERLAAAVARGDITQAQADERTAQHEAREAQHDAMHVAIKNNDYSAWAAAAAGTPLADSITEANFATFIQAHQLRESGDHEGAKELMDSIGITRPEGGPHSGRGMHEQPAENTNN